MIHAKITIVPPGGGEADYCFEVALPALPRTGDYVQAFRTGVRQVKMLGAAPMEEPAEPGMESFIVRRVWWLLKHDNSDDSTALESVMVECEFADGGSFNTESHKRACQRFKEKDFPLQSLDVSGY
jgi:hypothetical protein